MDGSDRLRIRFNVKGNRGHIYVWAEVRIGISISTFFSLCYFILLRRFPIEMLAENSCILSARGLALDASTQ